MLFSAQLARVHSTGWCVAANQTGERQSLLSR